MSHTQDSLSLSIALLLNNKLAIIYYSKHLCSYSQHPLIRTTAPSFDSGLSPGPAALNHVLRGVCFPNTLDCFTSCLLNGLGWQWPLFCESYHS